MSATPTAQEVFDLAVAGVLKQGKRCTDERGNCLYRGDNGMKCAAGFVFEDDEVRGASTLSAAEVISQLAPRLAQHEALLLDLQSTHDNDSVERWPLLFRELAMSHSLSPAVIDQWEAEQAGGDS